MLLYYDIQSIRWHSEGFCWRTILPNENLCIYLIENRRSWAGYPPLPPSWPCVPFVSSASCLVMTYSLGHLYYTRDHIKYPHLHWVDRPYKYWNRAPSVYLSSYSLSNWLKWILTRSWSLFCFRSKTKITSHGPWHQSPSQNRDYVLYLIQLANGKRLLLV